MSDIPGRGFQRGLAPFFEDLPRDVVLHLCSLLPPRVGRLVCRGSRDAVDASVVEELDLRWRGDGGGPPSLDGALSLLNGRLPRLSRVAFVEPERQGGQQRAAGLCALLTALRERGDVAARGGGGMHAPLGLRSLSVASMSPIDATTRGHLAAVMRTHADALERLDARLSVFHVSDGGSSSSSSFCGALGALARLRSLSIGALDGASMRLAAGAIAALPALERLEVEVVSAVDGSHLWTALSSTPAKFRALRDLTVRSFFSHPLDLRLELGHELPLSLPSLTSLDVATIGPCVSQLTALRSLRLRILAGWNLVGGEAGRALAALAPLTALTRLEVLSDPYWTQWPPAPATPHAILLPLLRVLNANRLAPALLQHPGSLPSLTELSCTPPSSDALQGRFAELVRLRLPQLASLTVRSWPGNHATSLGRPSDIAGLTRLAAHSDTLSPPSPWATARAMFRWPRRPAPASRLARLEVVLGPDCDLAELLRGLPMLSSLKLSCFTGTGACRCTSTGTGMPGAIGRALAPLGALVELELAGHPAMVLAMLSAAAADPSTTTRVERLTLSTPISTLSAPETAEIAALTAAFTAVRAPHLLVQHTAWTDC